MDVTTNKSPKQKIAGLWRGRVPVLLAALLVVAAGLVLRRFGNSAGLSFFTVKYGGSLLWGAMVYLLVKALWISSCRYIHIITAEAIAIAVELVRLIHTPELDAFRDTVAGALLLGKVFSPWNMLAYSLGIGLVVLLEWHLSAQKWRV